MKLFLCGAIVPVLVLGLASFTPAPTPTRTVPLKLSDLTLDRAFRQTVPNNPSGVTVTMPTTHGVVLTSISMPVNSSNLGTVGISINGGAPEDIFLGGGTGADPVTMTGTRVLEPPYVVRPGDVITITSLGFPSVTLGGYVVYPGEV